MQSPTGYYAIITTSLWRRPADGDEVLVSVVDEVFPVIAFSSGRSQIVDRNGDIRIAKEYAQDMRDALPEPADGERLTVDLVVTPHTGDVEVSE